MTAQEQRTINQIGIQQATMKQKQSDMTEDIVEIKADIKEIKNLLMQSSDLYVSKKVVKYMIGLTITVSVAALQFWDHVIKK